MRQPTENPHFAMSWWPITANRGAGTRSMDIRLENKGWVGMVTTTMSRHEIAMVRAWISQQSEGTVWTRGVEVYDDFSYRVGPHPGNQIRIWVPNEVHRKCFTNMLENIPSRMFELFVTKECLDEHRSFIRRTLGASNWCLWEGINGAVLSIADQSRAAIVKMIVG